MDNQQANQTLYQKVKKYRGAMSEIAKKSGKSREWIRLVMMGEYPDANVIDVATKVLESRYKAEQKIMENAARAARFFDRDTLAQNAVAFIG
jgi:hypothetical protein